MFDQNGETESSADFKIDFEIFMLSKENFTENSPKSPFRRVYFLAKASQDIFMAILRSFTTMRKIFDYSSCVESLKMKIKEEENSKRKNQR